MILNLAAEKPIAAGFSVPLLIWTTEQFPKNGLFTADLIQKKILLKIRLLERARGESVLAANPEACDDGSCFGKQNGGSNSNNSGDKQSNHDADKTVDGILTTAVVPQTRPTYSKRQ